MRSAWLPLLLACAVPAQAQAHTTPAALELLDGGVRIAHGLALAHGGGFRFVCPAAWGGPDAPAAAASDDGRIWVAGTDGVVEVGLTGAVGPPVLATDGVRELFSLAGRVLALHTAGSTTALVRVDGPEAATVWRSLEPWDDAAELEQAVLLGRREEGTLQLVEVRLDGNEANRRAVSLDGPGRVSLRPVATGLFLELRYGATFRLLRVEGDRTVVVDEGEAPHLGPVLVGGVPHLVVGGVLLEVAGDRLVPGPIGPHMTCIDVGPPGPYGCVGVELFALDSAGLGQRLFDLRALQAPLFGEIPQEIRPACRAQWADLQVEGRFPVDGGPAMAPDQAADCGCGSSGRKKAGSWTWLLAVVFIGAVWRRTPRGAARRRNARSELSHVGDDRAFDGLLAETESSGNGESAPS